LAGHLTAVIYKFLDKKKLVIKHGWKYTEPYIYN
jgi:hypothetical protein